ncbi:nitroreductase family protein [Clostridium kluyveri]|uniref:nitroreductase family protein n=1 Tax=Clostridium kluyveri TaxID=1534 RepID=UPI0022473BB9|nr:nitroreductase family protein [Clostridium kluyveri]UZQ50689.1 nitroreductase family protein [Clostridium kluyveri]
MIKNFYEAVKHRRSIYGISKEKVISDDRIIEVVEEAVKNAPSAFNSQTARVVVLLGQNHDKLWDITEGELKKRVPAERFSKTAEKIQSFRSGYGSVLFFEDEDAVSELEKNFPRYKENFPIWSQQGSAILQYIIWTSLEVEGFGASIQHYNPLIDEEVKKTYNIPDNWKLIAQLPFGKPTIPAGEKEIKPLKDRLKIFK